MISQRIRTCSSSPRIKWKIFARASNFSRLSHSRFSGGFFDLRRGLNFGVGFSSALHSLRPAPTRVCHWPIGDAHYWLRLELSTNQRARGIYNRRNNKIQIIRTFVWGKLSQLNVANDSWDNNNLSFSSPWEIVNFDRVKTLKVNNRQF